MATATLPYEIELTDPQRPFSPVTVRVPVADVEDYLAAEYGAGLLDEDGDPLTERVRYDAACEIAQRRANERRHR